jgi:hypothetical protein
MASRKSRDVRPAGMAFQQVCHAGRCDRLAGLAGRQGFEAGRTAVSASRPGSPADMAGQQVW